MKAAAVFRTALVLWIVATACACDGNPACESAKENLPRCGQTYYGDDNCELLTEDCSDDDLTVLDAAFQCIGDHCNDLAVCDIHFGRLTEPCQRSITGS